MLNRGILRTVPSSPMRSGTSTMSGRSGWLSFQPLHAFLEHFISTKEQGFASLQGCLRCLASGIFLVKGHDGGTTPL